MTSRIWRGVHYGINQMPQSGRSYNHLSRIGTFIDSNTDREDDRKGNRQSVLLRRHPRGDEEIAPNIALDSHLLVEVQ